MTTKPKPTSAYKLPSVTPLIRTCDRSSTTSSFGPQGAGQSPGLIGVDNQLLLRLLTTAFRHAFPFQIGSDLDDFDLSCALVVILAVTNRESHSNIEVLHAFECVNECFSRQIAADFVERSLGNLGCGIGRRVIFRWPSGRKTVRIESRFQLFTIGDNAWLVGSFRYLGNHKHRSEADRRWSGSALQQRGRRASAPKQLRRQAELLGLTHNDSRFLSERVDQQTVRIGALYAKQLRGEVLIAWIVAFRGNGRHFVLGFQPLFINLKTADTVIVAVIDDRRLLDLHAIHHPVDDASRLAVLVRIDPKNVARERLHQVDVR